MNYELAQCKKGATKLMAVTLSNLNRLEKFFYHWKEKEISHHTFSMCQAVTIQAIFTTSTLVQHALIRAYTSPKHKIKKKMKPHPRTFNPDPDQSEYVTDCMLFISRSGLPSKNS